MTDIEKAIETIKGLCLCGNCTTPSIKGFERCADCDRYKAKKLTIQALQEKAEREKGCEFCKNEEHRNDSGRIFYKEFPHDLNLSTSLSDAHLQIAFDNKSGWVLHFEDEYDRMFDDKITHCPMCSRKLANK